ncbi:hypothetical protein GQ53DRAFT_886358 [Thozetella sp. PMI_491]|nr:hypothetical protein GQ53DRAFT_886358 [Thozetella sp. PMI_491]
MEARKTPAVPVLSCELCRDRKVKCDKLDPCTNCMSAGVACVPVQRLRLPRGRHVHHSAAVDQDLKRRIRRLEALISDASPAGDSPTESIHIEGTSRYFTSVGRSGPQAPSGPHNRALLLERPDDFWVDLAQEVRVFLQEPEPTDPSREGRELGILGLSILSGHAITSPSLNYAQSAASSDSWLESGLCQVYLQQVDPIIKILHRPSLEKLMLHDGSYLGYPDAHASLAALKAAVMYSAAGSMTEDRCQALFAIDKPTLMNGCRARCEAAIERSGLLTTRDITVLQAFVLYLVGRRTEERSRAVWTLLALAVRVAKALSLHLDPEITGRPETFFAQEMRRRLWLTICLLDVQASFGQTSQPLISTEEAIASAKLPSHINDADFDLTTTEPVLDREGITDTTYAIVKYKLQLFGRITNFDMDLRLRHARQFEDEVLRLLHFCDPESSDYAWFTFHGAQCFVAGARAIVLRPLQRLREGSEPPPPRVQGDTELLRLSAKVLEKAILMHTDPRGEAFRWEVTIQWHALAIALAECYICPDLDLVRRVWPVVAASYEHHQAAIAGPKGRKLRGPLAKLMARAREKLMPVLQGHQATGESFTAVPSALLTDPEPGHELARVLEATSFSTMNTAPVPGSASDPTMLLPQQQTWSSSMIHLENQPALTETLSSSEMGMSYDELDQSWSIWEQFVSDISFDDSTSPAMFFYDANADN